MTAVSVDHQALTVEVHKIFMEMEANRPFYGNRVEQINDHTERIDILLQAIQGLRVLVDQNTKDISQNAGLAVNNDQ